MVHRVLDFPYLASEGPLTLWYMIRTAFYDAVIFAFVTYYALYGEMLFNITWWDVLVFEVLPPLYNYIRCPSAVPDPITLVALYMLYRFVFPAIRIYTFITPINTSWALPTASDGRSSFGIFQFMLQEHDSLFFTLWSGIAAAAIGRASSGYFMLDGVSSVVVMSLTTAVGCLLASWTMFVRPRKHEAETLALDLE
jgi:hypothetical protein